MPTLAILLAALTAQQAPPPPFVSEEGSFKIAMPAAPEEQIREVPSPYGPIRVHYYVAQHRAVHYIVSFSDYPKDLANQDPDKILEEATVGPVKGVGGTLLSKANRRIGQRPGKELEFSFEGPGGIPHLGRVRLYLAGTRMYSLTIIGPKDNVAEAGDGFFTSFALAKTIAPPRGYAAPADPATSRTRMAPQARDERPAPEPAAPAPPAAVEPFVSPEGGFRVTMPARPQQHTQKGRTAAGPIETHMYIAQDNAVYYVATYADLPAPMARDNPAKILEAAVEEKVAGSRGTLISKRAVQLGTTPGRDFESTVKSGAGSDHLARSRVFVSQGRLYQITIVGPAASVRTKAGDDFLGSFQLTGISAFDPDRDPLPPLPPR